jgi:hypothetical protein
LPPARTRLRSTFPAVLVTTIIHTTILVTAVWQSGNSSMTAITIITTMEAGVDIITAGLRRDNILFPGRGRDPSLFQTLPPQVHQFDFRLHSNFLGLFYFILCALSSNTNHTFFYAYI